MILFAIVFIVIGVLNILLVHPFPGMFYLLLSLTYVPYFDSLVKERFGFSIPVVVKVFLAVVVLWGTLAVGDLAEMLGL